jgi:arsenate reductase-like glutaredoxin family protein
MGSGLIFKQEVIVMANYKNIPRYNVISMRVSELERKELLQIASRNSLSISDMMRQAMDVYTRYQVERKAA